MEPDVLVMTGEGADPEQWCDVLGGIYVRVIKLRTKQVNGKLVGMVAAQHVHKDSHFTMLMRGKVRVWVDGAYLGDFTAPRALFIEGGKAHTFQALADDTIIVCNHDADGKDEPEVLRHADSEKG